MRVVERRARATRFARWSHFSNFLLDYLAGFSGSARTKRPHGPPAVYALWDLYLTSESALVRPPLGRRAVALAARTQVRPPREYLSAFRLSRYTFAQQPVEEFDGL
jgi:hypothetical protein